MSVLNTRLFQAQEYKLELYNNQAIIDIGFEFVLDDCGTETDFDFPDYVSSFLRVFNERLGRRIKNIPLTRNGNTLFIYSEDTDFDDNGKYYYEVGYLMSGGYEIVLRFGTLIVL